VSYAQANKGFSAMKQLNKASALAFMYRPNPSFVYGAKLGARCLIAPPVQPEGDGTI
jgi:hypothetical protein